MQDPNYKRPFSFPRMVWPRWGNGWCVAGRGANSSPAWTRRRAVRTGVETAGNRTPERIDETDFNKRVVLGALCGDTTRRRPLAAAV